MVRLMSSSGSYKVEMVGLTHPQFYDASNFRYKDVSKIEQIEQWGNIKYDSLYFSFFGANNMNYNANDNPDLSNVENMAWTFGGSTNFNGDISGWDTSNVQYMNNMFDGASSFNQDISSWDTSSTKDMSVMFNDASSFNQDISSWDTSNVDQMQNMFSGLVISIRILVVGAFKT